MAPVSGPDLRSSRVKNPQDLAAGVFFAVIAVGGLWIAQDYAVGTPQRMGTGAFPRILCWTLLLISGVIIIQSFVTAGERLTGWAMRPFIWVLVAILAFAFLLESAGLVVATVALLLIAAAGSPETRWPEVVAFTIFMVLLGISVFVWGLGLPLKVWPV